MVEEIVDVPLQRKLPLPVLDQQWMQMWPQVLGLVMVVVNGPLPLPLPILDQ